MFYLVFQIYFVSLLPSLIQPSYDGDVLMDIEKNSATHIISNDPVRFVQQNEEWPKTNNSLTLAIATFCLLPPLLCFIKFCSSTNIYSASNSNIISFLLLHKHHLNLLLLLLKHLLLLLLKYPSSLMPSSVMPSSASSNTTNNLLFDKYTRT